MKKKAIVCAALLLVCAMMSEAALSAKAINLSSVTSENIQAMEQQIKDAKKEKESLSGSISNLQQIKKELEAEKGNLKNYVAKLDENVAVLENNIANLQAQITFKEAEILQTQEQLESAQATADRQYDSMRTRIRFMYESGMNTSIWSLLAASESIGDFLNKADYINSIYAYDQKMWEEYQMNSEYIQLCKEGLELEKEVLDGQKANVEKEQAQVEELIQQKNQEITNYETDIKNKANAIREYEQDVKEQNEIITTLEQAVIEARKKILQENGYVLTYDGGEFKFPLASYTRVSDDYGERIHPILKVPQFHNGIDFASPKGTAIYAAYDGQVIAATYSTTMGNYVMIDHGSGLYTIYMHASKLHVKKDDIVIRGEKIAEVGSTGRSTGNHLHFSVRLNGSYVSPWDYLPD